MFHITAWKVLEHLDQKESEHADGENRSQLRASHGIKDQRKSMKLENSLDKFCK